jgi:hypothetical protein
VAIGFLRSTLDWFAKLGLTVRDDAPKTVDIEVREWGEPAGGFAVSIQQLRKEDPAQLPAISAALRNVSGERMRFEIPGWLVFYSVEIMGPDGGRVGPTAFGRELLKPERHQRRMVVDLAPGQAVEMDVPIGSMFEMREPGEYRVGISAKLPEAAMAVSNPITVRV